MGTKGRTKGSAWDPPYTFHTICECLRISRGCSRREMLERIGISGAVYEGWARIDRRVLKRHLLRVEQFFGVRLRHDEGGGFAGVEPTACDVHAGMRADVDRLIDERLEQAEITAEHLAAHLGCAAADVERAVRSETGHGVEEHVWMRRLAHARGLLERDARSVAEVAQRCGFRHAASFSRAFRRRYGLSPRGFRARVRASRGG